MKGFRMRIKIPERGAESDLTPSLCFPSRPLSLVKRARYYTIYLLFATIEVEEKWRARGDEEM